MNEKIAVYIRNNNEGNKFLSCFKGKLEIPDSYKIIGVFSDNDDILGNKYCDFIVEKISLLNMTEVDDVLIMTDLDDDIAVKQTREHLNGICGIDEKRITSYEEITKISADLNTGSMLISEDVPRDTFVDFNYLVLTERIKCSNFLDDYFINRHHGTLHKWLHYFDVYDKSFLHYRNKKVTVLEIGVYRGGSLQMWKEYFGEYATIVGVDIDPRCVQYAEERINIEIGSQEDRVFLNSLVKKYGKFDVIIDDGGHTMNQQIVSFNELFPVLSYGGVYLCEDCHTSYWDRTFGGGYKRNGTFIEFAKDLIDVINQQHIRSARAKTAAVMHISGKKLQFRKKYKGSPYENMIRCISFYDSIVVVEKEKTGHSVAIRRNVP